MRPGLPRITPHSRQSCGYSPHTLSTPRASSCPCASGGHQPLTWAAIPEEGLMGCVGLLVTLAGFLVAAGSVGLATANGVRLVIVLVGIAISLGGILGLI